MTKHKDYEVVREYHKVTITSVYGGGGGGKDGRPNACGGTDDLPGGGADIPGSRSGFTREWINPTYETSEGETFTDFNRKTGGGGGMSEVEKLKAELAALKAAGRALLADLDAHATSSMGDSEVELELERLCREE
jgi:hypothetical protein